MSSTNIVALYISCPSTEAAQEIARALVSERLIASANILPGATSIYRWEGKVTETDETLMICKTSSGVADAAITRAKALHPSEIPCITMVPVEGGLATYLRWIKDQLV
jgi:periplasmic divalent cation tolerance protein